MSAPEATKPFSAEKQARIDQRGEGPTKASSGAKPDRIPAWVALDDEVQQAYRDKKSPGEIDKIKQKVWKKGDPAVSAPSAPADPAAGVTVAEAVTPAPEKKDAPDHSKKSGAEKSHGHK